MTRSKGGGGRRVEAVQKLEDAGRAQSVAAVRFHVAVAAIQGLSGTEGRALDLLDRLGPLTAGELAERSGLAPASVTGLVDRLTRRGLARRVAHPEDRRRVLIELEPSSLEALAPVFADFSDSVRGLCERYTLEEIEVITRFLVELTAMQHGVTERASSGKPAPPAPVRPRPRR